MLITFDKIKNIIIKLKCLADTLRNKNKRK